MKRFTLNGLAILSMVVMLTTLGLYFGQEATAQKSNRAATAATLDSLGTVGASVFYQLTDDEGGNRFTYANGSGLRKVPAIVTFDPLGARGPDGRLTYSVRVFRPGFLGGAFDKDNVSYDSGRDAGTIDTIQLGDIYR